MYKRLLNWPCSMKMFFMFFALKACHMNEYFSGIYNTTAVD